MPSFFPYLIFFIVVGSALESPESIVQCSTSCGLQTIRSPFRTQYLPDTCGSYELICDENHKTILELFNGKYYVTEILGIPAIQIVDTNLASGQCRLPHRFPSIGYGKYDSDPLRFSEQYQFFEAPSWASFVNCSSMIQDDTYLFIPCLSGNSSFVYVIYDYRVGYILPSCSYLSSVPTRSYTGGLGNISEAELFQLLQIGFIIQPFRPRRYPTLMKCLKEALRETNQQSQEGGILIWVFYPSLFWTNFWICMDDKICHNSLFCYGPNYIVLTITAIKLLVRFLVAPLTVLVFLAYNCWKMMVPIDRIENFLRNQPSLTPTRYAYSDIIAITRHFKEKLGQGGFGTVYKGELPGGRLVAVKMLGTSKLNGDEFINEVSTIGRIHHLNVVRLVGFCSDGSKRALVYEFMVNGSLDKYIFTENGTRRHFETEKLNEIALGVARGIDYLHCGCDMRILHFDIKPHNILLDQNFNPKVSDFGLAKLYSKDNSLVSMSVARGTIGYIAPELVSRCFGAVSHKSDVYSFGMLLMEMAGGRRNVDNRVENSSQVYYPSWIYDRLAQSEGHEICSIEIDDLERKLCKVGLWCIQMRPSERPSMSRVIEMLGADVDTLQMAPKPFLSTGPVSIGQSAMDFSTSELSIISEDE